jgi:hypothetical protein
MKARVLAALGATLLSVNLSQAAEFTGGSFDLNYSQIADDSNFSRGTVRGSAELGFNRNWAAQLDLGSYSFETLNETGWNGTLHGIYHMNEQTSLGAYLGVDDILGSKATIYGVEAGFELNGLNAEGYLGAVSDSGQTATMLGGVLTNELNDSWGLNAGFDFLNDTSGVDLTRLSIGADYHVGGGATFYGEVGSLNATFGGASASEPYVGVGLRLDFGAERGSTFGHRGLLDKIPGL